MTRPLLNNCSAKSTAQKIFEYILLALCLCVIALRATYTESPNVDSSNPMLNVRADFYSLCISAVLIFTALAWFIKTVLSKTFRRRYAGMRFGLVVFTIAAVAAIIVAANTRAAITDFATLIAPMLMAVLLVQILDSHLKIKLVLYVIVALGVAGAYQCADQFFSSNQVMIEQYEADPGGMLRKVGIEPGTYHHMFFEHRLYSKDVRGFFMTGNSAGSFFLLACFAAATLLIENLKNRGTDPSARIRLLMTAIVTAVIIFGLALTRSKGAIAAAGLSALMFAAYLLFGKQLETRKKAIFALCLVLVVAAGVLVAWYGLSHGRLPGGKSVLVRWQYWSGAGKMYAEHPFTGVGGGNFAEFYPRYKAPAAPETVRDPHNFLLSLLAQYGPLGLMGFLAAVFIPLCRTIFPHQKSFGSRRFGTGQDLKFAGQRLSLALMFIISVVLLVVRPVLIPAELADDTPAVIFMVILLLYVTPAMVFVVAFLFLSYKEKTTEFGGTTRAAVFCAIVAVLIHNCVDFAIFEPGILTAFWALVACLIVLTRPAKEQLQGVTKPGIFGYVKRFTAAALALAAAWALVMYVLVPVETSTRRIEQAKQAVSRGWFDYAHARLAAAAQADCLSPAALYLDGQVRLGQFDRTKGVISAKAKTDLLLAAENSFLAAMERNNANFKTFERLTEVYNLLARYDKAQNRMTWLGDAYVSAYEAVDRFPGCARLRVELGKVAEELGRTDVARQHYRKAVEIEDAYRGQFREMFPGREVFSRLGQEKYQFAKQRIKNLTAESAEKSTKQ